jgi:DNA-binding response OmpR family regulator
MNILHLEDDGPLREILAAALKAVEPTCEIYQFVDSDKAIQYALNNLQTIDLFILDIRVPGSIDGLEVARRVRGMNCSGAIVLTSAYRAPSPELIKELNCEWFPKPWHIFEATTKLLSLAQKNVSSIVPLSKPDLEETRLPEVTASPSTPKVEEAKLPEVAASPSTPKVEAAKLPEVAASPSSLKVEETKLPEIAASPSPLKVEETKPNEIAPTPPKTDAT